MIRITIEAQSPEKVVLKIEGYISERTVDVLKAEGERWLSQKDRLILDLAGVRFIDAAGLSLLQGWRGEGLVLRGASRFIVALLKWHGLYEPEDPPSHQPNEQVCWP